MKYLAGVMVLIVAGIVAFAVYRWHGNRLVPDPDASPSDQDPRLTYDTPEIIAVPVLDGSDKYLAWLRDQV